MAVEASIPLLRTRTFHMIGLPYENNSLTMYLVLPRAHGIRALEDVLGELKAESIRHLKSNSSVEEVIAIVPKFTFDGKLHLKEPLKKQGLNAMFSKDKADFSNLVEADVS